MAPVSVLRAGTYPKRAVRSLLSIGLAAALTAVLAVGSVIAGGPESRTVEIRDNCDPASFNAALGPGACVREGGLTFDALIERLLARGEVQSWRFSPEQLKLMAGGTVTAVNRGGEFHTFTEVAAFGGGCVDEINALIGLSPVAECAAGPVIFATTGVAPGETRTTPPLAAGRHLFQCVIHPWQRTTVEAR